MKRKSRKSQSSSAHNRWSNLPWEKVDVTSVKPESAASGSSFSKKGGKNEEPVNALFFGLEVIDGSKYVIKQNEVTVDGSSSEKKASASSSKKGFISTFAPVVDVDDNNNKNNAQKPQKNSTSKNSFRKNVSNDAASDEHIPSTKKRKKKNKNKNMKNEDTKQPGVSISTDLETNSLEINNLRISWSAACQNSIWLHPVLAYGLLEKKFAAPTPIQASTLPASILGRRNIVGAAPTGSGKTLAYALPILQFLLDEQDKEKEEDENKIKSSNENGDQAEIEPQKPESKSFLRALIMCPTRELALQVSKEIKETCKNQISVGTIVGGLAEQKQKRVLDKIRPSILVATPGRLWQLMSSEEHSHLQIMKKLRYLVIDEADRMISQGNFPQLRKILSYIQAKAPQPGLEDDDESNSDSDADSDSSDEDRLHRLHGVRGESKVKMLDMNILEQIEKQRLGLPPSSSLMDEAEIEDEDNVVELDDGMSLKSSSDSGSEMEYTPRQTFIYSATLTLPSAFASKRRHLRAKNKNVVEGAIADILEEAGAFGETKVVDLTVAEEPQNNKTNASNSKPMDKLVKSNSTSKRLPPGLSLFQIMCTQKHKDSHCYAYLATTQQGSSGPCLIFCNSISGVKRVATTLQTLGLPVRMLHAQMAQKARFSSLESLKKKGSRAIVVATDVAARGLDIPSVSTVIHYDVARTVDTFIHRAGRTARGVGKQAVGSSISLVAPGDDERKHISVCRAIQGETDVLKFEDALIDGHLLRSCQERTSLATKIVLYEEAELKVKQKNKWFTDAANEAGIDLDEDLLEDTMLNGSDKRDRMRAKEAIQAKSKLRQLLAKPMRKQNFGKFLSGAGMAAAMKAEKEVTPFVYEEKPKKKRKRK